MEKESSKLARLRRVGREPWCIASTFFLFYIAQGAVDKYLLEDEPVSDILAWLWETTLSFPQKPLVQLFMIPLAIWMFYNGIKKIGEAEKLGNVEDQKKWAEETAVRSKIARPSAMMARCYGLRVDLDRLASFIDEYEKKCDEYGAKTQSLVDHETTNFDHVSYNPSAVPEELETPHWQCNFFAFTLPDWTPSWKTIDCITDFDPGFNDRRIFVSADNKAYLKARADNLKIVRSRICSLRSFHIEQSALLKRLEKDWMEMVNE